MTPRLLLRQLEIEDAPEIFALRSNESVNKYLDRPSARAIEDAQKFIHQINRSISNSESLYWAITLKERSTLIGTIVLWNISTETHSAEIGYELMPDFQGQGYMQEALSKVTEYGFEIMKLESVVAVLHPDNIKSVNLLKRNGFVYNGTSEDLIVYSATQLNI